MMLENDERWVHVGAGGLVQVRFLFDRSCVMKTRLHFIDSPIYYGTVDCLGGVDYRPCPFCEIVAKGNPVPISAATESYISMVIDRTDDQAKFLEVPKSVYKHFIEYEKQYNGLVGIDFKLSREGRGPIEVEPVPSSQRELNNEEGYKLDVRNTYELFLLAQLNHEEAHKFIGEILSKEQKGGK